MNTENNKTTKTIGKTNNVNASKKEAFSYSIYNNENFESFKRLKVDTTVKSIDKNDLPSEFSEETCEFIEIFHRKTVNEPIEWNFYLDYEKNEIIHCFKGDAISVKGKIHSGLMKNRKILSIHNHPPGTYSAPSASNFEILEHEFEKYEIICSENEYWILNAEETYEKIEIEIFKTKIEHIFQKSNMKHNSSKKKYNSNDEYSKELCKYINNLEKNIKLIKKEYR